LNKADLARLNASVRFATSRNLVVLLAPHNYARYYGTNIVGGSKVGIGDFADFWAQLALEFKNDPYVWFGLVNEPHDMPTEQWFEAANACIAAIRRAGACNLILVPGNSWSGAHSWRSGGDGGNARHVLGVKDPLDYWAVEVHQYLDADSSGTHRAVVSPTIGSERLVKFVAWCRQHQKRAVLGEFGVPAVPNGQEALADMLSSMERDRDVWLGWTWWAAGARWGNYMFTIEPKDGADRPQMTWLKPHLHGATMPEFAVTVRNGTGGGLRQPALCELWRRALRLRATSLKHGRGMSRGCATLVRPQLPSRCRSKTSRPRHCLRKRYESLHYVCSRKGLSEVHRAHDARGDLRLCRRASFGGHGLL
jgi:endoglucanase